MFKELDVEDWVKEIDDGMAYRCKYGLFDLWTELEALYYDVHPSNANSGPNIIASQGDAMLSALNVPKPRMLVKATRPETVPQSRILEAVDNLLIQRLDIGPEIEHATLCAFLWSRGILKIGYDSEWGWDAANDIMGLGASLSQFDRRGRRIEYGTTPGMPWVRSIVPHDFIVPWGTRQLAKAPWAVHRVVRHIEELRADPKYENTRDLEPVMSMEDFVQSYVKKSSQWRLGEIYTTHQGMSRKTEFCELWEIHDARDGKVKVIASGFDKFVRNERDLMQIDGLLPFVDVGFVPQSRTFWTTSDAQYLKQQQAELSDITIQAQKQRRASVLKFFYSPTALSPEAVDKALSSEVAIGIPLNPGVSLQEAIMTMTPGNNNLILEQEATYVRRNAQETMGQSRNSLGEFDTSTRRSATEATIVKSAGDQRSSRRMMAIRRCYTELFQRLNGAIFQFWKSPRWVQICGVDAPEWESFIGASLRGDYLYDLELTSENFDSLTSRKQQALSLYQGLAQDPMVDPQKLRTFLSQAFNDPEFSGMFRNASVQSPVQQGPQAPGLVPGGPTGP
jgi:hypothetical protein